MQGAGGVFHIPPTIPALSVSSHTGSQPRIEMFLIHSSMILGLYNGLNWK